MIIETEIWKPKKDYEGLYEVSNFGRVKSLNYRNTGRTELLNLFKDIGGYLKVGLNKNGKKKIFFVHRLVAETFIPNPNNLPFINHIDENKKNNSVDNLEWCTREYNNNYGTRNERSAKARINGKCSKKVLQFTLDGILVKEWPSSKEVGRNGYDGSNIRKCCRGERNSAHGYIWKYKE